MQRLNDSPRYSITEVTPDEISNGVLGKYDVVIFAGGSARQQSDAIDEKGREQVRQFVKNGGGYVGLCAGAYLATSGFPWSLHIINAETVSPKWQRGVGQVKIELTKPGVKMLGERSGEFEIHYSNGPVVKLGTEKSLPPYETLALFRTEMAKNGSPEGVMVNSPAIFSAPFERGRVICISPHPEQTQGLEDFVPRAIDWVVTKETTRKNVLSSKAQ
jgi:glutamine amidotransferase-like uncharacterized protein